MVNRTVCLVCLSSRQILALQNFSEVFLSFPGQPDVGTFRLFVQRARRSPPQFASRVFFAKGRAHFSRFVAIYALANNGKTMLLFEMGRAVIQCRRGSGCSIMEEKKKASRLFWSILKSPSRCGSLRPTSNETPAWKSQTGVTCSPPRSP